MNRPPVVTGPDGLPHCGACQGEEQLCTYHRREVGRELSGLLSAHTLAAATTDLRFIVGKKYRGTHHPQEA